MNGNHFNVQDMKKEFERWKKQGVIEELEKILGQLDDIHYCNDIYCEGAEFKRQIKAIIEKRLLELKELG